MRRLLLSVLLALAALAGGSAAAQTASFNVTPGSVSLSGTLGISGPFSTTGALFYTYGGTAGLSASLNAVAIPPLAEPVPDWLGAYAGTSLTGVVSGLGTVADDEASPNLSLSASGYVGITFAVSSDVVFYVQTGPSAVLLPSPSVDFGGSAAVGFTLLF